MDRKKWLHLFVSLGLPVIGLVMQYTQPRVLDALCYPLRNLNPQPLKADSGLALNLYPSYDKLSEWVDRQRWGDYPIAKEDRYA